MKIAIIGGSAFSTPHLIRFLDSNKRSGPMEVVLAGRSLHRLEAVKRASSLVASEGVQVSIEQIHRDTWRRILEDADCVLIQFRVGGFEGRCFDETFPHKYGLCGDEGLGPSSLSVGWRTWPMVAEVLEAIQKFCPRTFVILMTSPLSPLVRAAYRTGTLNLAGICELPWTTLQELSKQLGIANCALDADYLGVNHLGWFFNFRNGSRCLDDEIARTTPEDSFPSGSFLRAHGCYPSRYLRLHYEREKVLREQLAQKKSRAETLAHLQNRAYAAYSAGSAAEVAEGLKVREAPWYSHAVGPLMLAMQGNSSAIPFFLSVPNGSFTDLLEDDDVIECRHSYVAGELVRAHLTGPPPDHLADNLSSFVAFERLASEAIMMRSVPLLIEALSLHPWTQGHPQIREIADEIVTYNEGLARAACQ
jgi:6-phospho-beta-glucosidase